MKSFDEFDREFDSHFRTCRKLAVTWFAVSAVVVFAVIGFVGWVVVKLLSHFGVV